jgi:hypothetical protein
MLMLLWGLPDERPMRAVADALQQAGVEPVVLDQRRAGTMRVTLEIGAAVGGAITIGRRRIDLTSIDAAYARPYDTAGLHEPGSATLARAIANDESLLSWCDTTPALVLNRPSSMASNSAKPYQLQLIRAGGFAVPETLVTTDREAAEAFWEKHGAVIYKSVSSVRSQVSQLTEAHRERLGDVAACPTQFQQYIPGCDHRVHVVGDAVFACALECDADDYRYAGDGALAARAVDLPDDIAERCIRLSHSLGLPLAGIDLRLTPDGEWYCFEVNPSPAFTFYSGRTGQDIAGAIAALMIRTAFAAGAPAFLREMPTIQEVQDAGRRL